MQFSEIWEVLKTILHFTLFTIDNTPITVSSLVVFLVIFSASLIVSSFASRMLASKVLARLNIDKGMIFTFRRITYYILASISAIFAFQFIGINLSGLAVIFGLLSVGIGFGLQNVTSNFIAGIILLFERPIKVGDRVTVGDAVGDVIAINMRSTTIRSLSNITIIVPNSEFISSQVINWSHTDPKIRLDIDVGVSYDSDPDLVKNTLLEVANENKRVLQYPKPAALILNFGDSAWDLKLQVWIASPDGQYQLRSDINSEIIKKFRERNIEIPFPQRDINFRNSLPNPSKVKPMEVKNDIHHDEAARN